MRWRRRPSTASCSCSTARRVRRSSRSRSGRRPPSDVPGERAAPTQPVPVAPPPLVPQRLDRGGSLRADARASRGLPREARRAAQRRPLHAAEPARLDPLSLRRRRRELVGRHLGSGAPAALRAGAEPRARDPQLERVAERATGGGANVTPLHGFSLRNAWWLLTGRGTGERYRLSPIGGRTLLAARRHPVQPAAVGRARRASTSRAGRSPGARRPASARTTRADARTGPLSRPPADSSSTLERSAPYCACTTRTPATASRPVPAAGGPARGTDHLQAAARRQAVPRDRAGRPRRDSARRSATTSSRTRFRTRRPPRAEAQRFGATISSITLPSGSPTQSWPRSRPASTTSRPAARSDATAAS